MTEQELVEKVAKAIMQDDCCGLTLETKERVFCDDERLPKDTRYKTDECKCKSGARAAISVIREALSEPSPQAEVDRLRVALARIEHECIIRRPEKAVQTVKDVRAIARQALALSY